MGKAKMASALLSGAMRPMGRQFSSTAARRSEVTIPGDKAMTEHAVQATADWKKYSKMAVAGVGAIAVLEFFVHLSHHHHEDNTLYPYRKTRNKPFPWGDGQHSLFGCSIDDAEEA